MRYQTEVAANAASLSAIGYEFDKAALDEVSELLAALKAAITELEHLLAHEHPAALLDEARYFCDVVVPASLRVREASDALEGIVADDLWPLASYQEMLFVL